MCFIGMSAALIYAEGADALLIALQNDAYTDDRSSTYFNSSSSLPEVNTVIPWKCICLYIHYNYPWNWKTANLSVNVDC